MRRRAARPTVVALAFAVAPVVSALVSPVVSTLVPTIIAIANVVPVVISMLISAVIVAIAAVAVRARKDNDVTAIGAVPQAGARMRRYRRRPRAVRRPLPLVRAARMPARQGKAVP